MGMTLEEREAKIVEIEAQVEQYQEDIEDKLPSLVVRMNAAIDRYDRAVNNWWTYKMRLNAGTESGGSGFWSREYQIEKGIWMEPAPHIPLCVEAHNIMEDHNPKDKKYGRNRRYEFPTNVEFDNMWSSMDLDGKNNMTSLVFTCNHGVSMARGKYQGGGVLDTGDHDPNDEDAAYLISDTEPSIHNSFVGKYSKMSGKPETGIGVWWEGWPSNAWKQWLKYWNQSRTDDIFFESSALSAFHLGRRPMWYIRQVQGSMSRGSWTLTDDIDEIIDDNSGCDMGGPNQMMGSMSVMQVSLRGYDCIWSPRGILFAGPGLKRGSFPGSNTNFNPGGTPRRLRAQHRYGCGESWGSAGSMTGGGTAGSAVPRSACGASCISWPNSSAMKEDIGSLLCRVPPNQENYFKMANKKWVAQDYLQYMRQHHPGMVESYNHNGQWHTRLRGVHSRDYTIKYGGRPEDITRDTYWAQLNGMPTPDETYDRRRLAGAWSSTTYTSFLYMNFSCMDRVQWECRSKTGFHYADLGDWYTAFWECYYAARNITRVSNEIADLEKNFTEAVDGIMDTVTDESFGETLINAYLRGEEDGGHSFFGEPSPEALAELSKSVAHIGGTWVSTNSWRKQMLFKEQCFLLSHIHQIARAAHQLKGPKVLPYQGESDTNACLMADGRPYAFVNQLTQEPSQNAFFKMSTHELSALQPTIRLFKVVQQHINYNRATGMRYSNPCGERPRGGGGSYSSCRGQHRDRLKNIEYQFDGAMTDLSDLMSTTGARGTGVGIKKFSFTYDGSNPFAAKKSIKATLEIFANSFHELIKWRGSDTYGTYQYTELAMKSAPATRSLLSRQDIQNDVDDTDIVPGVEGLNYLDLPPCEEADLVSGKSRQNDELADLNFMLKAVVGWALPPGSTAHISPEVQRGIYNSFVTLYLTPTVHEFDVDDMGRVVFRINFLAFAEDFYSAPVFSVFAEPEIVARQYMRRLNYSFHSKTCNSEEMRNIKETDKLAILEEKRQSVQHLVGSMFSANKIFYIDKPYQELREWIGQGPFYEGNQELVIQDSSGMESALRHHIENAVDAYEATSDSQDEVSSMLGGSVAAGVNPNAVQMGFFYISDLVDVALGNIQSLFVGDTGVHAHMDNLATQSPYYESGEVFFDICDFESKTSSFRTLQNNFEKLRTLLGPVEIVNQLQPGESMIVNMGDLPVSVKYFTEFLTKRLSTQDEVVYPLTTFLNDLFQDLLRNFLNNDTCFATNIKQRVRLNQATLSSYKPRHSGENRAATNFSRSDPDEITRLILEQEESHSRLNLNEISMAQRPVLNISGYRDHPDGGNPGEGSSLNYLVYFAGRTSPKEYMTGNAREDAELYGIQHYMLGEDRGIVKNIKLNKTNSTGLQEVRFEQSGYDGFKQLHLVYDIDIETYANVKTFPGTYVFVDPRGFAPQSNLIEGNEFNLTEYGLGGYCMIIRSTSEFGPGRAITKLHTKWVHSSANQLEEDASEEEREANFGDGEANLCRDLRSVTPPTPAMDVPEVEEPSMAGSLLSGLGDMIGLGDDDD